MHFLKFYRKYMDNFPKNIFLSMGRCISVLNESGPQSVMFLGLVPKWLTVWEEIRSWLCWRMLVTGYGFYGFNKLMPDPCLLLSAYFPENPDIKLPGSASAPIFPHCGCTHDQGDNELTL